MTGTTSAAQPTKAQELAAEIEAMSAEVIQEVADLLTATPDREIFGDTEFAVRAKVLKIVAKAFTARLAQKKTDTTGVPSPAPIVDAPPSSRATATETP